MESPSPFSTRREWLFIFLAGLFITNAITAELIIVPKTEQYPINPLITNKLNLN